MSFDTSQDSTPTSDQHNLFSWQFIWAFFIRAPRVRSWLFQKQFPPASHVAQALLSGPVLLGYMFTPVNKRQNSYRFPDIGDLSTVFCRDGNAFLGFNFGFKSLQPVLPMLFEMENHPTLSNCNVIVRRTAYQKAPSSNCYISIEFSWLESGALAVATDIHPIHSRSTNPPHLAPYFEHAEFRVFNASSAARLTTIAESLGCGIDLAYFPHLSHFTALPPDFLDPPDDYYTLLLRDIHDPIDIPTLHTDSLPARSPGHPVQSFEIQNDFVDTKTSTPTASIAGATMDYDCGEVTSVAGPGTIALWNGFKEYVSQSRRTGVQAALFSKKMGGCFAKEVPIFDRCSQYQFLSTSGISVYGRIQRLCKQLGIETSSPHEDLPFISGSQPFVVTLKPGENESKTSEVENSNLKYTNNLNTDFYKLNRTSETDPVFSNQCSSSKVNFLTITPWSPSEQVNISEYCRPISVPQYQTSSADVDAIDVIESRAPKRRRCSVVKNVIHKDDFSVRKMNDLSLVCPLQVEKPKENGGYYQEEMYSVPMLPLISPKPKVNLRKSRQGSKDTSHISSNEKSLSPDLHERSPLNLLNDPNEKEEVVRRRSLPILESKRENGSNLMGASIEKICEENRSGHKEKSTAPSSKKGGNIWTCYRCGMQIRGKKGNLNRHIANKHDNIRAYGCTVENCGRKFQTRLNLVRHERAVHLGRPFICSHCPRTFKHEKDLESHVVSAHENADEKLACGVCGSCFGQRSTLNRHMTKVHKGKK